MQKFNDRLNDLFSKMGEYKSMVLSTAYQDSVTSRMMSVIILDGEFYFQTDKTFRKYEQIMKNSHVALCADNISIEGVCTEIGNPVNHTGFIHLYKKHFPGSYHKYSRLANERLFKITPQYIQLWSYDNDTPYVESFHCADKQYSKAVYEC